MLLTYCSNVHPLDGWDALQRALAGYVPAIRAAISPKQPFPLGLWLSEAALTEAERQGTAAFQEWCTAAGCFVLGFNGFPYGAFHAGRVKEQVYLPDWRSPARTEYTCRLATLLDRLLPSGMPGSITTVPLGWGPRLSGADLPQLRSQLVVVLEWLDQLRQASGKTIRLALEPEPGCLLET
ncbi:MAG: xylose isomerase, partial [Deltaproteobacteria bacterium]|nr:xylose isomerase [Deltaproteobacteria bacterium]